MKSVKVEINVNNKYGCYKIYIVGDKTWKLIGVRSGPSADNLDIPRHRTLDDHLSRVIILSTEEFYIRQSVNQLSISKSSRI